MLASIWSLIKLLRYKPEQFKDYEAYELIELFFDPTIPPPTMEDVFRALANLLIEHFSSTHWEVSQICEFQVKNKNSLMDTICCGEPAEYFAIFFETQGIWVCGEHFDFIKKMKVREQARRAGPVDCSVPDVEESNYEPEPEG